MTRRLPAWLTTYLAITAGGRVRKVSIRLIVSRASRLSSNPIGRAENLTGLYSSFVLLASTFSWFSSQYVSFVLSSNLRALLSRTHRAMMLTIRNIMVCATRNWSETTQQYFPRRWSSEASACFKWLILTARALRTWRLITQGWFLRLAQRGQIRQIKST